MREEKSNSLYRDYAKRKNRKKLISIRENIMLGFFVGFFFFFFFWLRNAACKITVPWSGIEWCPTVEAWSLNHWSLSESESCSLVSDSVEYTVRGILQARILEWVAFPFSRGCSQPRDWTQVDSLPAEPPGKPKNIGVGSLSLLQWIFPTQELNWGFLHYRWILYQLSYQGSPLEPRKSS